MLEALKEQSYNYWAWYKQQIPNLTQFSHHISNQEIMMRIEDLVIVAINQMSQAENPSLRYLQWSQNCQYDANTSINRLSSSNYQTITVGSYKGTKRYARLMKVIDIIYSNLKEGRKSTKREIYYKDPKLFSSQLNSDSAIDTAAALLQIPRNRLNILSAGKGLVAGKISFNENDTLIEVGNRICKIPPDIESINNILIDADYILIIEKDTVLTRLIEEKFFENHNAIAVTGCGYPDLLTREFVRRIIEEFSYLPTFIMTDFDPHGFQILSVYTFGSYKSSGECDSLALPFSHWLGVHFGDCENNPLPLTDNDLKLLKKMIERPQFNQLPNSYQNRRFGQWKQGLEMMVKFGSKYEIENLLAIGSLTDYVNFKLENGAWI